jgi:hypothetical protein
MKIPQYFAHCYTLINKHVTANKNSVYHNLASTPVMVVDEWRRFIGV